MLNCVLIIGTFCKAVELNPRNVVDFLKCLSLLNYPPLFCAVEENMYIQDNEIPLKQLMKIISIKRENWESEQARELLHYGTVAVAALVACIPALSTLISDRWQRWQSAVACSFVNMLAMLYRLRGMNLFVGCGCAGWLCWTDSLSLSNVHFSHSARGGSHYVYNVISTLYIVSP